MTLPSLSIRPLTALLIAFIAGILIAPLFPLAPSVAYLLAAASLSLAAVLLWARPVRPPVSLALLLLPFLLLGIGRTHQISDPIASDISRFAGQPSLWVCGRVASLIERSETGSLTFDLQTEYLYDFKATLPVGGRVRVTQRKGAEPGIGQRIWLRGKIESLNEARNPGAFDYRIYSQRHGAFCRITVRRPDDIRPLGKPAPSLLTVAQSLRRWIQSKTARYLTEIDSGLSDSLLLSIRSRLPGALEDTFQRTGTVHILSVSGLHLTAFVLALTWLFRYLLLPRPVAHLTSIALIWLFVLAAGGTAAPLRAAVMATVLLIGPLLRRQAEPLHSLAFSALVLLFADPGSLLDAGFQLSFVSVWGLLLIVGPVSQRYLSIELSSSRFERLANKILTGLFVGIVAELVTAPLVAYHFNLFSPIAPVANILIASFSELILLSGLVTLALTPLAELLPPIIATILWVPLTISLWLLRLLSNSFAALPFASFSVASPPLFALIVYYALLGGVALFLRHRLTRLRIE